MTSFILKIIALTAMILDHIGNVWSSAIPNAIILRIIGRLAFPVYAFLIAEGCRRTKNIKKYMLRLGLFALISEIPFDLCFQNINVYETSRLTFLSFGSQNVFFTLFLGVLAVFAYNSLGNVQAGGEPEEAPFVTRIKKRLADPMVGRTLGILACLAIMLMADRLNTDYGALGVLLILAAYFTHKKPARTIAMLIVSALICAPYMDWYGYLFGIRLPLGIMLMSATFAGVLLCLTYNGKRGPRLKYFFYAAYPLHLLILAALRIYVNLSAF